MSKKEVFLYIQAALWLLWTILMAAMAIRIYCEGAAYQAQGHPEVWIFTREKVTAAFAACAPVFLAALVMTIAGAVKGIRDEKADQLVPDPDLIRIYKAERRAAGRNQSGDTGISSGETGRLQSRAADEAEHGGMSGKASEASSGKARKLRIMRAAVFVLAAVFIIAGVFNGSMEDVLIKAINICTECIGLG